jgi:hypothetical protein
MTGMEGIGFVSLAAGHGYISILFFSYHCFWLKSGDSGLRTKFDIILGPNLRYRIVNNLQRQIIKANYVSQ